MGDPRRGRRLRAARKFPRCGIAAIAVAAAAWIGAVAAPHGLPAPLSATVARADSTFDADLFSLFNQDRRSHGVAALQSSGSLSSLSENASYGGCGFTIAGRAEDMIQRNYLSHTIAACGGQNVFNIMRSDGIAFSAAAENLGYVQGISDPNQAAQWINAHFMADSEHAGNILDASYDLVGVGSWWTSSGQTWSGAGAAQSNVLVVAAVFMQTPAAAAPPPPPPPPPAPSAPPSVHSRAGAPVAHRAASVSATAATAAARAAQLQLTVARPAMPETGVLGDGDVPGRLQRIAFLAPSSSHGETRAASQVPTTSAMSIGVVGGAAVLMTLGSLRRLRLRRRHGRPSRD